MSKALLDASCGVVPCKDFAYNDDHILEVVDAPSFDVDAYIQSFADSCGMDFVLKSVAAGDLSVLNARNGVFGDFSGSPETLAQVQNQQAAADAAFESLPDSIKNGRSAQDVVQLTTAELDAYIKQAVEAQLSLSSEVSNNEQ